MPNVGSVRLSEFVFAARINLFSEFRQRYLVPYDDVLLITQEIIMGFTMQPLWRREL